MSRISRAAIYDVINTYEVPGTQSNLVALKAIAGMEVEEDRLKLQIHLLDAYKDREGEIRRGLGGRLAQVSGVAGVDFVFTWEEAPKPAFQNLLPTVKCALVVASGKGGVGKSSVAANLACAAAAQGLKVGLLDADLYGPSMGMMFGITEAPNVTEDGLIQPAERFGVKLMSMAFLVAEDRPVIWRGPMLNKALQQFLGDVAWGDLDLLLIDLPPGTGDVQISLVQNAKVNGAVVVSTPQDVAFLDARKAITMFQAVDIPVVGVVENMSSFLCPHCGQETQIFGHGGVRKAAEAMGLPFLGEVPIDLEIRSGSDEGTPLVAGRPDSPQTRLFHEMVRKLPLRA